MLTCDDVAAEVPIRPLPVTPLCDGLGDVDDDRVDEDIMALGELDQGGAGGLLDVGGVDDGEQPPPEPGADDVVQDIERVGGGGLVVLVVGDSRTTPRPSALSTSSGRAASGPLHEPPKAGAGTTAEGCTIRPA